MTEPADYKVGPGHPPLHSRFQKGRSGNPGGKPSPSSQLKARFQLAIREALEKKSAHELTASRPSSILGAIARQLVLDANIGRPSSQRLLLTLLETDIRESEGFLPPFGADDPDMGSEFEAGDAAGGEGAGQPHQTQPFSLSQGESEGAGVKRARQFLEKEVERRQYESARERLRQKIDIANEEGSTPGGAALAAKG
ncbi:MAG TPA: DUF5681 domain-containing protein [Rhizomicrobium sp.]